jgi:hypothetical protein
MMAGQTTESQGEQSKTRAFLEQFGTVPFSYEQRERFRHGELREEWYRKYPELFDERDLEIAINQPRYHFFEWLAAIVVYESTGFPSLIEQYEFKAHPQKRSILRKILPDSVFQLVTNHSENFTYVQNPDLFVYSLDHAEWFFYEVKGPGDRISASQSRYFTELYNRTLKPIKIINFRLQR